ncbi:UDP-N-acetylmuramoyl-L-alanine--D-glutamate ligase [Sodalis sp. CWE]|uniref:UDP-N-acetylmuramoyl-L-alanine--D-glutamate ligase n=1 Tax=Sodalis sp. CWE TaxID=2803816 RepID=UPI001C7E1A14|nr:UDP-N-acetylmuramoyl-L-alanine--D-glutamate ligase [Sodalis sp. CWE]MBX4180711.1 UDP-N-acetylmuramoyl-L-alanine--D-glutamate ligase [Sodalis sp. CWE]
MKTDYRRERVVIIGLGITGVSCVNFFHRRGVIPYVIDTCYSPIGLGKIPHDIPIHLGSLHKQWLLNATLIVKSPGVPSLDPSLISSDAVIVSDIELFAREALEVPVVAVTGTNGKSTVVHMVNKMASKAGLKVGVGGNFGLPALELLNLSCQLYILELSSFQLENTYSLKVSVATVLNISKDHMNRYSVCMQQYRMAKLAIYRNSLTCLINTDDISTFPEHRKNARFISFGIKRGDYCLHRCSGKIWLMAYGKQLLECKELRISGVHNYTNALAALAIADELKIPRESSLMALRHFCGLAHRFELIHKRNGVHWVNDSKSTNTGSTEAALDRLEVVGTLHLILGGDGKSADFTTLQLRIQKSYHQIRLYCFGQDGAKLASLCPDKSIITDTLEQAMRIIGCCVKKGDLVLLSPACASLDQFINFEERGETFTRLALELG